jgi:GH15 family glucan-1,4-alpha-glucosidase
VEERLWSEHRHAYLMKEGSEDLDCAVLLAARRGFADPAGERLGGTIRAIRSELGAEGPLLYRFSGMGEQENAFLACSFWLVESLALGGQLDQAAELMDQLVARAGPLGLYSEEMDPRTGRLIGNVPQALTHLSLLGAAALFEHALSRAQAGQAGPGSSGSPPDFRFAGWGGW